MTVRGLAGRRPSQRKPRPGWCRWPARRPSILATRTSCGPRGCWPGTFASTRLRPGIPLWRASSRARSARSSRRTRSSRTLERRDEAFEPKMAEVLCVYREVAVLKRSDQAPSDMAIISYDEKPGIQAISNTAPDLPPQPGAHEGFARDQEYQRHGTL